MNDIQNDGTASVNLAFTEAWDRGACKPPSVAIRSLHNVINRYLAVTRPMEVESLSGGNIDIITFLARHSEREIFPQDVERRFGITRSTSSRVLALMERKGLIVRESVPRDARLKKIVLTDKSRDIAEALRANAVAMEGILLQGLSDDEIREFMHVLDVDRVMPKRRSTSCGKISRSEWRARRNRGNGNRGNANRNQLYGKHHRKTKQERKSK